MSVESYTLKVCFERAVLLKSGSLCLVMIAQSVMLMTVRSSDYLQQCWIKLTTVNIWFFQTRKTHYHRHNYYFMLQCTSSWHDTWHLWWLKMYSCNHVRKICFALKTLFLPMFSPIFHHKCFMEININNCNYLFYLHTYTIFYSKLRRHHALSSLAPRCWISKSNMNI